MLYQAIAIPAQATEATLSYWYYVQEIDWPTPATTTLNVELRDADSQLLLSISTINLGNPAGKWRSESYAVDLSTVAGQTVLLYFDFQTDQANAIFVDDVDFNTCVP